MSDPISAIEEQEVNQFAMELLMPTHFLQRDVREMGGIDIESDKAIKALARQYKVSEQLMTMRLGQLMAEGVLP